MGWSTGAESGLKREGIRLAKNHNFHQNPFDQDTKTKLELYETYLEEWLPVFIQRPQKKGIHIFDFFAGPGTDSDGTLGSPLIALSQIERFSKQHGWGSTKINCWFYDVKKKNIELLNENLNQLEIPSNVECHVQKADFQDSFKEAKPLLDDPDSAKLVFIDQFGVSQLKDEIFCELTYLPKTDFLCFVASHTLHRFSEHPNIKQKIQRPNDSYDIHRAVFDYYAGLPGVNPNVFLAPFTIKKGSNIYGLIFGSQHPLGIHKFLQAAWKKDAVSGEANFDIDRTDIKEDQPFLCFEELRPTKIRKFESDLETGIRDGLIGNEQEILSFCIYKGFTGAHATTILMKLKKEGVIALDFRTPQIENFYRPRNLKLNK